MWIGIKGEINNKTGDLGDLHLRWLILKSNPLLHMSRNVASVSFAGEASQDLPPNTFGWKASAFCCWYTRSWETRPGQFSSDLSTQNRTGNSADSADLNKKGLQKVGQPKAFWISVDHSDEHGLCWNDLDTCKAMQSNLFFWCFQDLKIHKCLSWSLFPQEAPEDKFTVFKASRGQEKT